MMAPRPGFQEPRISLISIHSAEERVCASGTRRVEQSTVICAHGRRFGIYVLWIFVPSGKWTAVMAGLDRMRGGTVAVIPSIVFGGPERRKRISVTVSVPNVRAFCETALASMGVPEANGGFAAALHNEDSSGASGDEQPRSQNQAIISRHGVASDPWSLGL